MLEDSLCHYFKVGLGLSLLRSIFVDLPLFLVWLQPCGHLQLPAPLRP